MNNKTTRNSILLLVTAAVWGAAFVAQTVGGQTIGAYSFNCVRCIIGALVLIPVMKFLDKKDLSPRKPQTKEDYKLLIKGGICCGVALCISTNLQQVGILMGASAGKAGFLTAVYILLVPILGLFLHKKCARFVSEKLSTLEYVNSTATYFVLKKYKEHGLEMTGEHHEPERMLITP